MKRRFQILDGTALKIIAVICMVFDHIGDSFFPEQTWMRAVGRIAMPVFAFCIAEGFIHTHDKKRYMMRMGIFALISEVPFDLFAGDGIGLSHQNIMFTFFWAMCGLVCYEKITENKTAAAKAAGLTRVFIPKENDAETLHASGIEVICVSTLAEVMAAMLLAEAPQEALSATAALAVSAAAQGETGRSVATAQAEGQ
jgi:hypothetical protein